MNVIETYDVSRKEFRRELKDYIELANTEDCILGIKHYKKLEGYYVPKELFDDMKEGLKHER